MLGLILTFTASVTPSSADDKTPDLMKAVRAEQIDKVKELLNAGADVNPRISFGVTPLKGPRQTGYGPQIHAVDQFGFNSSWILSAKWCDNGHH